MNQSKQIIQNYQSANVILKQTENVGALVLGDCNSAMDNHVIKPYKIKTILSIGKEAKQTIQTKDKCQDIAYLYYDVQDNKNQKILNLLDQIYEIVQIARNKGGVLIHCYSGVSRSSSFVIGYIMRSKYINYDQAKQFVKKIRNCIYPNDGFIRQLQAYWKILVQRSQQKSQVFQQKGQIIEIKPIESQPKKIEAKSQIIKKGIKGAAKKAIYNKKDIEIGHVVIKIQQLMIENINGQEELKNPQLTSKRQIQGVYGNKTKVK